MSFPTRSQHPKHCHVCRGTGWQPAPPVPYRAVAAGEGYTGWYSMLTACTHDWRDDDPNVDADGYDTRIPIPIDDQRARAAFDRGVGIGLADLHAMREATDDPPRDWTNHD